MRILQILVFCLFWLPFLGSAQSCTGYWITIDDHTGLKKSIVELYKKDGILYGKVVYIYKRGKDGPHSKCTECEGALHNQPIMNLLILSKMKWDGQQWSGGSILDPDNGKFYTCTIWLDENQPNQLHVRGYIGPFFRTQDWVRTNQLPKD
ncbi:MAG: hypothetical protein RL078_972 [Bacteroidota bacterium]|jgi:uncharacterized protein (DUF2147 family)